eukprot:jgi/Undpi1/12822/HiC_scaffold_7.g02489.m1
MRGAFVVMSRPDEPEEQPMARRGGLGNAGHPKDPELLKEVLGDGGPLILPSIHKKRAPEGTQMDNDLGTGLRLRDLTDAEKAVMWDKYQQALDQSMRREGDMNRVTWQHRTTKEPAMPLRHHAHRRLFTMPSSIPYGSDLDMRKSPSDPDPNPPLRSGRKPCKATAEEQGDSLLTWEVRGAEESVENPRPSPRKLPPTWDNDPHVDALMDDERSIKLTAPVQKQRRHLNGYAGEISEAISPVCGSERREIQAREMHEFTVEKRKKITCDNGGGNEFDALAGKNQHQHQRQQSPPPPLGERIMQRFGNRPSRCH